MLWRFGFHACSAIDTLLDKPDVTLEEILGEDDLLQECKAHNTKLIEYLRDPKILSKLLNYIIADEQVDDKAKFKYNPPTLPPLCCFFVVLERLESVKPSDYLTRLCGRIVFQTSTEEEIGVVFTGSKIIRHHNEGNFCSESPPDLIPTDTTPSPTAHRKQVRVQPASSTVPIN